MHREQQSLQVGAKQDPHKAVFADVLGELFNLRSHQFDLDLLFSIDLSDQWVVDQLGQSARVWALRC